MKIEETLRTNAPDLFSKFDVLKTKLLKEVYPFFGQGFPGGNDHGPEHIKRVLENLEQLVGDAVGEGLVRVYELYLAMMAILYHDIAILSGRDKHPENAGKLVVEKVAGTDKFCIDDNNFLFDPYDRNIIRAAVVSHGSSQDIKTQCRGLSEVCNIGPHSVRPRLIAALVRFADELDEDYRRAPKLANQWLNLPEKSRFYWRFCERISGIRAEPKSHRITIDVHFQPGDVGHMVLVDGSDRLFLFAFAEKLAKINRERVKTAEFFPDAIKYTHIVANVAPLEDHTTWDQPRQFLFGDATTASDFIRAYPELLDPRLNVNLLNIFMLFQCSQHAEALVELQKLKLQAAQLNEHAQHFVLYNLACALSVVASSKGCADPDSKLDAAAQNISQWVKKGQAGLWASIKLDPKDAFRRLLTDRDLKELREKRREAIKYLVPVSYLSWLEKPPESLPDLPCIASGSIVATPAGGLPIQGLQEGMTILSFDLQDSGALVPTTVTGRRMARALSCIHVNETLLATSNHRVYEEMQKWIRLRDVQIGMKLLTRDGSYVRVDRLDEIAGEFDVFDLSIDSDNHNFIANGFVVHNVS